MLPPSSYYFKIRSPLPLQDLIARDAPLHGQLLQEADSLKYISLTEVCSSRSFGKLCLWLRSVNYVTWSLY